MNQTLAYLGLALFASLPPAMLFARYRLGRAIPWWAVWLVIAGGGWLLVNCGNYFHSQYLCEGVDGVWDPPEEALARCTNDGAANAFALLFGWLYALVYSLPFLFLFSIAIWVRRR